MRTRLLFRLEQKHIPRSTSRCLIPEDCIRAPFQLATAIGAFQRRVCCTAVAEHAHVVSAVIAHVDALLDQRVVGLQVCGHDVRRATPFPDGLLAVSGVQHFLDILRRVYRQAGGALPKPAVLAAEQVVFRVDCEVLGLRGKFLPFFPVAARLDVLDEFFYSTGNPMPQPRNTS